MDFKTVSRDSIPEPTEHHGRKLTPLNAAIIETADTGQAVEVVLGTEKAYAIRLAAFRPAAKRGYVVKYSLNEAQTIAYFWVEKKEV